MRGRDYLLNIGCHLSGSQGYLAMVQTALEIDADTFQFFTRNPRGSQAKEINPQDVQAALELMKEHNFPIILAHAPYTLNACAAEPRTLEFAITVMADDLRRMEFTPNNYYNFHPGSHVGQGAEVGVAKTAETLNQILKPEQTTTVLLETMAGKGTEIGRTFEELRQIIDKVDLDEKLGVCLDTCHVHDGGYDIVNDLDGVLEEFDRIIGLNRLKAVHLNDSMNPCGAHKDRHQQIGKGYIGLEAMVRVINHPKLRNLPFFLETPNELPGYAEEIKLLKQKYMEA